MNIGFISDYDEKSLKLASRFGFDCLEISADKGTELDVDVLSDDDYKRVAEEREKYDISFDSVSCSSNHLIDDETQRKENNRYFIKLVKNARKLGSGIVMTNAWADPKLSPEDNIPRYKEVFSEYARAAEVEGVRIVVENCAHVTDYPVTIGNISYGPEIWDAMFDAVPSKTIGIEYDPSHMLFLRLDYIKAIHDYGERIYACHAKDAEIDYERLGRVGIYGRRSDKNNGWRNGYWRFRMPGLGQIDWKGIFRALSDINYKGPMFIEHEDPVFDGARFEEGLWMGLRFLRTLAAPNPDKMGRL